MPPAAPPPAAETLVCRGLAKSYAVGPAACAERRAVLRDLSLVVDRGTLVATLAPTAGGGLGARTLLRCLAGLATPDAGTIAWRGPRGERVPPPRRALVGEDWRPSAACLTVRDVVEGAVPVRTWQPEADRRVALALESTGLAAHEGRLAAPLAPAVRWRVGVAAALAAGAEWLLLEPPAAAAGDAAADNAATRDAEATAAALLAARRGGVTILASVRPAVALRLPGARVLHWRGGALARAPVAAAARRVAEWGAAGSRR